MIYLVPERKVFYSLPQPLPEGEEVFVGFSVVPDQVRHDGKLWNVKFSIAGNLIF
jgi:hypothetical protein